MIHLFPIRELPGWCKGSDFWITASEQGLNRFRVVCVKDYEVSAGFLQEIRWYRAESGVLCEGRLLYIGGKKK